MKMIKNATTALVSIAAVVAMTACSSDSDSSSGGGGSSALATGGFIKTYAPDVSTASWLSPFNTSPRHYQIMYQAEDVDGSGNINALSFRLSSDLTAAVSCPETIIKFGHTKSVDLSSSAVFADHTENGAGSLVTVLDNRTVTFDAAQSGEYVTIPLDTPFEYNGVDNLVVDILRDPACTESVSFQAESAVAVDSILWTSTTASVTGSSFNDLFQANFSFEGGVDTVIAQHNTGDNGNSIAPGTTGRTQALLRAEDINGSGPITGIAFEADSVTALTEMNITITMMNTSLTALDGNFTVNIDGSSTPVIVTDNLQVTIPAGVKYFWIPMTSTFDYDGSSNLLLDITSDVTSGGFTMDYENVPVASIISTGTLDAETGTVRTRAYQPKLRFNGASMDVITAGDAVGWYTLPFNGSSGYRTQFLYGGHSFGTSGAVTEVSFRLENDSVASDYSAATILLGHTANTTMTTDMPANMDDNTSVFSGTLSIPAGLKAGDWVTFPVSGFTYDSTKNLVVEVSQDAGDLTNVLRGTQTDVPGVGGYAVGTKGLDTGFGTGVGHVDVRITVSK